MIEMLINVLNAIEDPEKKKKIEDMIVKAAEHELDIDIAMSKKALEEEARGVWGVLNG